jgi:hypothetical protein
MEALATDLATDLGTALDTDLEARLVLEALVVLVRLVLAGLVRSALVVLAHLALVLEARFLVLSFSANLMRSLCTLGNQLCHTSEHPNTCTRRNKTRKPFANLSQRTKKPGSLLYKEVRFSLFQRIIEIITFYKL